LLLLACACFCLLLHAFACFLLLLHAFGWAAPRTPCNPERLRPSNSLHMGWVRWSAAVEPALGWSAALALIVSCCSRLTKLQCDSATCDSRRRDYPQHAIPANPVNALKNKERGWSMPQ
jgi:hypothetical protein